MNPFENMPAVWRERYAELVVHSFARSKSAVVLLLRSLVGCRMLD